MEPGLGLGEKSGIGQRTEQFGHLVVEIAATTLEGLLEVAAVGERVRGHGAEGEIDLALEIGLGDDRRLEDLLLQSREDRDDLVVSGLHLRLDGRRPVAVGVGEFGIRHGARVGGGSRQLVGERGHERRGRARRVDDRGDPATSLFDRAA